MYGVDLVKAMSTGDSVLLFEEGRMASVLVTNETRAPDQVYLRVDGKVDASSGGDMETQLGLAYFPRFLRPKARDVCVIGYGSGSTAGASGLFPGTKVTCCEIEPAVYAASRFFENVNHDPPSQPGFRLVLDDGRNFLQGTRERYDLIISEPSNPWMPGIANLFTRDFYETVRSRLNPGGLIGQWIQVYDFSLSEYALIVRTIGDVFPHVALIRLSGIDTILLASMEPIEASPERASDVQLQVNALPPVQADLERTWGTSDVRSLLLRHWFLDGAGLARLVGRDSKAPWAPQGRQDQAGSGLNTDLNMRLEFDAPLRLFVKHAQSIPVVDQELVAAARASWFAELWRALGAEPQELEALLAPMYVLREQRRTAEAQALLTFAAGLAPEHPSIQAERFVDELASKSSPGPADLAKLDALSPEVVAAIGFSLGQANSHAAAAAIYHRLVERTPRSAMNWVNLGENLEALARWDEADASYRKALQIEPANPQAQKAFRSFQAKRPQTR
jgi:spermidine synthase